MQDRLPQKFIEVIPRTMWAIRYGMRSVSRTELTVPQFRVMAALWHGPKTNSALAESIGISVPAMSRLVDGLVGSGIVVRTQNPQDRRQVGLELSPEGRKRFSKFRKCTQDLFSEKFAALSQED